MKRYRALLALQPETIPIVVSEDKQIINLIVKNKRSLDYVSRIFNQTVIQIKLLCFNTLRKLFNDLEADFNTSLEEYITIYHIADAIQFHDKLKEDAFSRYKLPIDHHNHLSYSNCLRYFKINKNDMKLMISRDKGIIFYFNVNSTIISIILKQFLTMIDLENLPIINHIKGPPPPLNEASIENLRQHYQINFMTSKVKVDDEMLQKDVLRTHKLQKKTRLDPIPDFTRQQF